MAERLRSLLRTASGPVLLPEVPDLESRYTSAVFSQKGKAFCVMLFCEEDNGDIVPDLIAFGSPQASSALDRYESLMSWNEFLDLTKTHRPALIKAEEAVVSDGALAVEIPSSILSPSGKPQKKMKQFIDKKRLVYVTRAVYTSGIASGGASLCVLPVTERDVWLSHSFAAAGNRATFIPFVAYVLRQNMVCPCFPVASKTSIASYPSDEGLANVYCSQRLDTAGLPKSEDVQTAMLFELLYSLWFLHTDLKVMVCDVGGACVFARNESWAEGTHTVYRLGPEFDDTYLFHSPPVRAMLVDFTSALIVRDSILLQGASVDSFQYITRVKDILKGRMNYDLDILKFQEEIQRNDNWIELNHTIFALDYAGACSLFPLKIAKEIVKMCDRFVSANLAMMVSNKRPKSTFNQLWSDILDRFKQNRFSRMASKPVEKYTVQELYKYDEMFNFCPDMSCLDGGPKY